MIQEMVIGVFMKVNDEDLQEWEKDLFQTDDEIESYIRYKNLREKEDILRDLNKL